MTRFASYQPQGVIPASLTPFDASLDIDERAFRKHIADLASVDGVTAICVNGHAGEVASLTPDEQRRAASLARQSMGSACRMAVGIYTNSSLEAVRLVKAADQEGTDALLVFPPDVLSLGGHLRPASMIEHLRRITGASDLPIILFQLPFQSNLAFPLEMLVDLCDRFPQIRAIKDQYGDGKIHERQIRELASLDKPVNVLTTHSTWLLGSLAMGCQGILSGAGSVIANLQVALFRAVQQGDLKAASQINDRIFPTVRAFYDVPMFDQHNRMKVALTLLGRLPAAHVRPPLVKLEQAEVEKIGRLIREAGLESEQLYAKVA
jgi:4-hydroxy-tetrahydrodipicolinate synthase